MIFDYKISMISMTELIRNVDKEIKLADPDLISPNLIEG